jgi:hypothetical protein
VGLVIGASGRVKGYVVVGNLTIRLMLRAT